MYRLIIILVCIVVFINSCNSVISTQFGTHKLRKMTMQQVEEQGLGDADYVEITDAYLSTDFIHVPAEDSTKSGTIIYPVLNQDNYQKYTQKQPNVDVQLIAWSENIPWKCWETDNCIEKGKQTLIGIVRTIDAENDKSANLSSSYNLATTTYFVETNRTPTPWYWHALLMLVTAITILILELWRLKKHTKLNS